MDTFSFRAMNSQITLAGEGDPVLLQQGFEKVRTYIEESEKRFTRFSDTSELSKLNASTGSWFQASPDMLFLGMLINQYVEQTRGLFDPSVLTHLERIGYDRSMDLLRADDLQLPSFSDKKPDLLRFKGLLIHPKENQLFLQEGRRIDLGGIAKGWIAENSAHILAEYSPACIVDAGGDMFMIGAPENQTRWSIDIEDPRNPGQSLTTIEVPPGAIATSSTAKRKWLQGDVFRHHIIDPRTGEPAVTDWLSVTVMAPHADTAEVFAKALLIAGSREAELIAQNIPDIYYLAIAQDGMIWGTPESLELIYDYKTLEKSK